MSNHNNTQAVPEVWPGNLFDSVTVYLICGHKRYTTPQGKKRWVHYIGATTDLNKRIRLHRSGRGAKLCRAMRAQGIRLRLVRTWQFDQADDGWKFEKQLKRQNSHAQLCPKCSPRRKLYKARSEQRRRREIARDRRRGQPKIV